MTTSGVLRQYDRVRAWRPRDALEDVTLLVEDVPVGNLGFECSPYSTEHISEACFGSAGDDLL